MAKLNKLQRCYHCRALLQDKDPDKEGYISPKVLADYPEGFLLCNKCYEKEKFEQSPKQAIFDQDYLKILNKIKSTNSLVVYVIDLFSFEGSFINQIASSLKDVDILTVATKRDLLPSNTDNLKLKEYVEHCLRVAKLNVIDCLICSVDSNNSEALSLSKLISEINFYGKDKDIYFLGALTSGKSALISEILKNYSNKTNKLVETYYFEGTDLRCMRIPLSNNHYIFETPGTSLDNSIISKVERSVQNILIPKKEIKERNFTIGENTALYFGSLATIENLSKNRLKISAFASDKVEIKIHRGSNEKFFNNVISKGTFRPASDNFNSLQDFDIYDLMVEEEGGRDLGVAGLGWISFEGQKGLHFRIYVPKGVYIYNTRRKINYVNSKK